MVWGLESIDFLTSEFSLETMFHICRIYHIVFFNTLIFNLPFQVGYEQLKDKNHVLLICVFDTSSIILYLTVGDK